MKQKIINNWHILLITLLALVGLIDSSYLTANHFSGTTPDCSLVHGCDVVLESAYSTVIGIPVALLGVVFYFGIFLLSILLLKNMSRVGVRKALTKALVSLATLGFLATLAFVVLQAFVINAWCQFCLVSAVTSTLIFIFALILRQEHSKELKNPKS